MATPQISFRPYIEFTGNYTTGLAGAGVNAQGEIGSLASFGMNVTGGISGVHSWRHTKIGVDYQGSVYHYTKATYFDSTNQSIMLGITHEFTRHTTLGIDMVHVPYKGASGLVVFRRARGLEASRSRMLPA